jgi:hypothetical protein
MKLNLLNLLTTLLIAGLAFPKTAGAETHSKKPVLLMLMTTRADMRALQETFRDELVLELETHTLTVQSEFEFASENLSERIDEIRRVAAAVHAEAVIWLEKKSDGTVSLQLVATAPGQSTVRSVEAGPDGDVEGELAVAARALLKDIRIAVVEREEPVPGPPRNASLDDGRSSSVTEASSNTPQPKSRPSWVRKLTASVEAFGRMQGTPGPVVLLGGALSFVLERTEGMTASLAVAVFASPATPIESGTIQLWGIRPGIGIGYLFRKRSLQWGPYLEVQAPWHRSSISLRGVSPFDDTWWNLRFLPSLEIRFGLHQRVQLLLRPGVGVQVLQRVFERASDGARIYVSPYAEWHLTVGVIFQLF